MDDVFVALERFKPGLRWDSISKALVWSEEASLKDQNETQSEAEVRTMETVKQISSGILDCLNFTMDTPAVNQNKMMPVLDTQVWVEEDQRVEGIPEPILGDSNPITQMGDLKNIVKYTFYKKSMADKVPNRANNALTNQMKITTAVQEVIRKLKNTSRFLPR